MKRRGSDNKNKTSHISADDIRRLFNLKKDEDGDYYYRCSYCEKKYKQIGGNSGTTTTLRNHVEKDHLDEALKKYPPKKFKKIVQDKSSTEFSNDSTIEYENEHHLSRQSKLDNFLNQNSTNHQLVDAEVISQAFILKLALDGGSYNSVKSLGNKYFFSKLFPEYNLLNRNKIGDKIVDLWEEDLKLKVKKRINSEGQGGICLTVDLWSDETSRSFLGFTVHFINNSWESESWSLALKCFDSSHTSENISHWIESICSDFGLEGQYRPFYRVNDGAANFGVALSKEMSIHSNIVKESCSFLHCSAHKLNLIAQGIFNSFLTRFILSFYLIRKVF
jgi:hypothetical protein